MARYIDADDLKHDLAVLFKNNKDLIDGWLAFIVDDEIDEHKKCGGVDLVRCKDCKYYCEAERMCNDTNGFDRYWKPTDLCSYGERRDNAEIH